MKHMVPPWRPWLKPKSSELSWPFEPLTGEPTLGKLKSRGETDTFALAASPRFLPFYGRENGSRRH